eukprot:CAMPEP_0201551284 /NCGR_PEP_ID=MMETSP0173_2-20130828/7479_1 /ASSEMBLY_ACC=CAM_ASM_000268 /TAXON_ID=218659 /ORGANISM="Vexillifera sp., Strain DIVA3 564/2" /LENGTH=284 /DNA_ID=CAMNT_0047961489 /DNA_START=161 /DNA_END=1018 /DNA_ORIENTATION=+
MKQLCEQVGDLLLEESNVQPVSAPVTICGDIHGQFYDLMKLFSEGGEVDSSHRYIFMGDFVDRGYYSLETFSLLLAYKVKYPGQIVLLRGNHESRQITQVYGFYDECQSKYGSSVVYQCLTKVFDLLPLAAIVDGRVLCVHGGISPDAKTLDQIRVQKRDVEVPNEGVICDLVWSDPDERVSTWKLSERGAGYIFGARATQEFNQTNKLDLICRAHQLVQEGYKYLFNESLVTVWSAPNYCYRCGNIASILYLDESLQRKFTVFDAVPDSERTKPTATQAQYFL